MFKSKWFWIVLVVVLLAVVMSVNYYNKFVTLSQSADTQWAQVENQFQRRFDLIPNLVESVKGIFKQEQAVFDAIAQARTQYSGATTVDQKATAAGAVETSLGRLIAVMENYPQLRSSENVTRLMDELAGTENRVTVERGRYNDTVKAYNLAVMTFPGNIFGSVFGYKSRALFEAAAGAAVAPTVKF